MLPKQAASNPGKSLQYGMGCKRREKGRCVWPLICKAIGMPEPIETCQGPCEMLVTTTGGVEVHGRRR